MPSERHGQKFLQYAALHLPDCLQYAVAENTTAVLPPTQSSHDHASLAATGTSNLPFSARSNPRPTFDTLAREEAFRSPSETSSVAPSLGELVAPHLESFNALFDDSGLHTGDGDGCGLLSLAIKDIGERVVFDRPYDSESESWGNRMSSRLFVPHQKGCFYIPKFPLIRSP